MKPYYEDEWATIYHGDCREVIPSAMDCVFSDPPYFKVKNEPWDRQWNNPDAFVGWLGDVVRSWRAPLADNGSVYCFASPQMATRVELLVSETFRVLNRIRWVKEHGWHRKVDKDTQRRYLTPWEAVIFAEHYGQGTATMCGWVRKCDELRGQVFEPLRAWLRLAMDETGWTVAKLNEGLGFAPGGMASHYFSRSQWSLPTAEHYAKMQEITGGFRREYEDLRREYEDLRRPFNPPNERPVSDLWDFAPVAGYPGKHPCEKPQALIVHALRISTKPGGVVFDPFMGSGATLLAARSIGRKAIGVEINEAYCEQAAQALSQGVLHMGAA